MSGNMQQLQSQAQSTLVNFGNITLLVGIGLLAYPVIFSHGLNRALIVSGAIVLFINHLFKKVS